MAVHALKKKRYIYLFAAAISFLVLGLVHLVRPGKGGGDTAEKR